MDRTGRLDSRQSDRLFHFRAVHGEFQRQIAQHRLPVCPRGREHVLTRRRTGQRFHHRQSISFGDPIDVARDLHKVPVFSESPESKKRRQESDAQ